MFGFAGISNDEHDYTIKEFHDFMNYDLMITWLFMILFGIVPFCEAYLLRPIMLLPPAIGVWNLVLYNLSYMLTLKCIFEFLINLFILFILLNEYYETQIKNYGRKNLRFSQ